MPLIPDLEEARACWTEVARALGGELRAEERRSLGVPFLRMELLVVVDGQKVGAQADTPPAGNPETSIAALCDPPELTLDVYRGYVYPIGRALGIQDVRVGEDPFDDRFIVKASHEELARVWLDALARQHMLLAEDYRYQLEGDSAVAICYGTDVDPKILEAALRAVAALASRGRRLLAEKAALAAALGGTLRAAGGAWRPDGSASIDVDVRGTPCRVTWGLLGRRRRQLATRVLAARAPGDPVPPSRRSEELRAVARPDEVLAEGAEVEARFGGLVGEPDRLAAALDLVAHLAGPCGPASTGGPYR